MDGSPGLESKSEVMALELLPWHLESSEIAKNRHHHPLHHPRLSLSFLVSFHWVIKARLQPLTRQLFTKEAFLLGLLA